jgi:transposase InsO family protein
MAFRKEGLVMPWQESRVVDQRNEFALRAVRSAEKFGELCREYGISRKTGYKWKERFLAEGLSGLSDQSRRPASSPTEIGEDMVCRIVKLRQAHPTWGASKLRAVLARTISSTELPSESSFKRILDKAGLVVHRRRVPVKESSRIQSRVRAERPNQVWTIDFKGWWYTRNRERFAPLTIRDDFSRYVLCAQAMDDGRTETVRAGMERVFARHGLPEIIRSDNGPPFAGPSAPLGLSRLSAWWVGLGIGLDRIDPGRPDQNGGHERMHRDLAAEVECRAKEDAVTQQAALDVWRRTFNEERPHAALDMRVPSAVYEKSPRRFDPSPIELVYPPGRLVRKVNRNGEVKLQSVRTLISTALIGWELGLEPRSATEYHVWFCGLCLGALDVTTTKFRATQSGDCRPDRSATE